MLRSYLVILAVGVGTATVDLAGAASEIEQLGACQRQVARAGATFAEKVVRLTLKCTNEIVECQVNCEEGAFGQPCDPDVPSSNPLFQECLDDADAFCDEQDLKIALAEDAKTNKIRVTCGQLSLEQLCGANTPGLNFIALNAGCEAIIPGYTCNLENFLACVGGPLQLQLAQQMAALLSPRTGDAIAVANLESKFPGIPVTRKVDGSVVAGKVDVYAFPGLAGEEVQVRVKTRDDNGDDTSNLAPAIFLLDLDQTTPVVETNVRPVPCNIDNVCGASCQSFKRILPFSGTFYLAVKALAQGGCTGGSYRLVATSPGGTTPMLVLDDVNPSGF